MESLIHPNCEVYEKHELLSFFNISRRYFLVVILMVMMILLMVMNDDYHDGGHFQCHENEPMYSSGVDWGPKVYHNT